MAEAIAESLAHGHDHRRFRRRAGQRLDHSSPGLAGTGRTPRHDEPADCHVLRSAPPVLEFDQDGNRLLRQRGAELGNVYDGPNSNHGITIDYNGNVWIGGNGRGRAARPAAGGAPDESAASATTSYLDNQVLKFTQDGQFLMQIGKPSHSKGSNDVENLRLPAKTFIDKQTNEVYVADGYGNHRVIVYDADTGQYKRHWGAYGHKPDDTDLGKYDPDAPPPQQFRNPVHCAETCPSIRLLYVCDHGVSTTASRCSSPTAPL